MTVTREGTVLGTGASEPLLPGEEFQVATAVARDGSALVYDQRTDKGNTDVMLVPLSGARTPRPLLASAFSETGGRLSADDRFLAYTSNETGRFEVYVAPFPSLTPRVRVSREGGFTPRWSPNGHGLYFTTFEERLMRVEITDAPVLRASPPTEATGRISGLAEYLPAPGGARILLLIQETDAEPPIVVGTNAIR